MSCGNNPHAMRKTQCEAILEKLKAARGQWVPMPELAEAAGAYAVHSRIADLRKQGWPIPAPRITVRGGRKCSEYRLIVR